MARKTAGNRGGAKGKAKAASKPKRRPAAAPDEPEAASEAAGAEEVLEPLDAEVVDEAGLRAELEEDAARVAARSREAAAARGEDPADILRALAGRTADAAARGEIERAIAALGEAAAVWTPIGALAPDDKNPRVNDHVVDDVAASIRRFGWGRPILARRRDGVIIAGHTAYKAARKLGIEKVPVRWMDLDPALARLLGIADNRLAEKATWDDELLTEILADARDVGLELDSIGFSDDELDKLLADDGGPPAPGEFPEVGEDLETHYQCPRCQYAWSGKPKPSSVEEAEAGGDEEE